MTAREGEDAATAFVPGHVSGFFSTHPADDPAVAGSRGAGLSVTDGIEVTVAPGTGTTLNGEAATIEAVEYVRDALGVDAAVTVETAVPVGAGFGVSGGAALGTALAANAVFECGLSVNELTTVAHGAEVQAGTGLGDVVAQRHGGVPVRLEPGGPQHNEMDAIPARSRVEFVTEGERSTADVIGGDTGALTRAGTAALSELVREPTLPTFMTASRTFSREAGLLSEWVREVVTDVAEAGGDAAMGMLGETVFALGTGLSDAGYDPQVCQVDPTGATLLPEASDPALD